MIDKKISTIRFEFEIKEWLAKKAKENDRSFNGEVNNRFRKQMEEEINAKSANAN